MTTVNPEAISTLAAAQIEHFNRTRDTKTKVSIALWTFLAVATWFLSTLDHSRLNGAVTWVITAILFLLFGIDVWWMIKIQRSLDIDKNEWDRYCNIFDQSRKTVPVKKTKEWVLIESGPTGLLRFFAPVALFGISPAANTTPPHSPASPPASAPSSATAPPPSLRPAPPLSPSAP